MDQEIYSRLNSNQDYPSGLQLFDRYGKNFNLARILRIGGANGNNRRALADELGKLARPTLTGIPFPTRMLKMKAPWLWIPMPSEDNKVGSCSVFS